VRGDAWPGGEAQHEISEQDGKGPILVIVAGMQRIEHYEIAAYGTDIALAKALGEQEEDSGSSSPQKPTRGRSKTA
jgi:hypothetical protein